MSPPIKLFFLDMEGTLYEKQRIRLQSGEEELHHSLWSRLMNELGEEARKAEAEGLARWESGGWDSYFEWVDASARNLRDFGLTRETFESVMDSIDYNPGVPSTVRSLHRQGIRTAIITGGFYEHARRAQTDLGITHAFAAIDLYWHQDGTLAHWNMYPTDYEGKIDIVRLLQREYGFSSQECAFVGDGDNDVYIAREVGTSFAYDAHPDLKQAATYAIDGLEEILNHL